MVNYQLNADNYRQFAEILGTWDGLSRVVQNITIAKIINSFCMRLIFNFSLNV